MRNTNVRGSVKRKRGEERVSGQCREEPEIHKTKRHKQSAVYANNKNPASPQVRKSRGEAIELPK